MSTIPASARSSKGRVGKAARRMVLPAFLAALLISSVGSLVVAADSRWTAMSPTTEPPVRVGHDMAYDSESDRVILFGGETSPGSNVLYNDTWAYDLNSDTWTNRNPTARPQTRFAHAMAYDTDSDRVILFGGWTGTTQSNETWAYDYNTNTWTNVAPATSPATVVFVEMAYDAESDRSILFGGGADRDGGGLSNETWAYDYDSNTWTRTNPSTSPAARGSHGMTYDPASDRVILFGGRNSIQDFGDTWAYDFNSDTWTRMDPETSPSARHGLAMAHDAGSGGVVLFGGVTVTGALAGGDETWVYMFDNDSWWQAEKGSGPSGRYGAGMIEDTESDRIVLFGGAYATGTWTGRGWRASPAATGLVPILASIAIVAGAAAAVVGLLMLRKRRKERGPA